MQYQYLNSSMFIKAASLALLIAVIPTAAADAVQSFVSKLKEHYQSTRSIRRFSISHRYFGRSDPFQSWDYQAPNRYSAFKVTDIDLIDNHYAQNVVHRFVGGQFLDEHHFQNDSESLRYERNGMTFGKSVMRQSMDSFERYKNITMTSIDFLIVRPILEEQDVSARIKLERDENTDDTRLIHTESNGNLIEYVFGNTPLRLMSVNNKTRNRQYVYRDYQTTNGLTFARSVIKYYQGPAKPSFISYIDRFDILEQIEPRKLQVPEGYGPVRPALDRSLISKEIAPDLHLITNASSWRNILYKVDGEDIHLYGAHVNPELAQQTIQLISDLFPSKNVSSVFVTHPHHDEIAALSAFVERGIPIRANAYTIEAIKAYPHFSDSIDKFTFETIKHGETIDGVQFFVLESSISKRQSFAYFGDSKIIYQADFLEIPADNTIADVMPSYSKTFIDFLRSEKLKFKRIVGNHRNNNISPETLNRVYAANIM